MQRLKSAWAEHIGVREDDDRVVYAETCGWPSSFRDFKAGWDAKSRSVTSEINEQKYHRMDAQKCLCGSSAKIMHWRSNWRVKCERNPDTCKREGNTMRTKLDAIREWNKSINGVTNAKNIK